MRAASTEEESRKKNLTALQDEFKWLADIAGIKQLCEQQQGALQKAEVNYKDQQASLDKLALAEKAEPLRPVIDQFRSAEKTHHQTETQLAVLLPQQAGAGAAVKNLVEKLKVAQKAAEQQKILHTKTETLIAEQVAPLDELLKTATLQSY